MPRVTVLAKSFRLRPTSRSASPDTKTLTTMHQAKDAHVGVVRNYTAPTPPQAPTLPSNLADELSKFDAEEPVFAGSSEEATTSGHDEGGENAAQFLTFLEADMPEEKEHH